MSQFELFMGDGWPQMMYETMFAAGDFAIENWFHSEKIPFYIYFMPIYFIFSHMMFNLVINQSQHIKKKQDEKNIRTPVPCYNWILLFFSFSSFLSLRSLATH